MIEFIVPFAAVWDHPLFVGLGIGAPAAVSGFYALRSTNKRDKDAAQSAVIAAKGDDIQRVIDGLDDMVKNLQADNKEVRERAVDLTTRLRECGVECAELKRMAAAPKDLK